MSEVVISKLQVERKSFALEISSLKLGAGKILGVMGKSGSGKTTLLHAIAGFVSLKYGDVDVFGIRVSELPPEKRKIALVFQKPWLFEHQTVLENVCFGLKLQSLSRSKCEEQARFWLKRMEIESLEKRKIWELSGGQAQRVSLARAMAVKFPLLLLDEPFSALDSPLRKDLRNLLKQIVQESKSCAILVTHDWRDIEGTSDQVLILDQGKELAFGSPEEIRKNPNSRIKAICED
ncbi:MAG: ABC transporter ATP-binding protein [Proteobacteria bacterium]|nr:ABC transporter ATP-binding protein [Pseudomonadota bacterium]NDC24968.1 ABC transporter ATP-binding protein [Pseudomonadota bacterium]NDG28465.1 ABC transporter ATP-binding protein [Pseudomonadota bacterium]